LLSARNIYSGRCACLSLVLALLANEAMWLADTSLTKERTVTEVASGVYVIRPKDAPNGIPNGNTEVIIGDREVLVVDSCYLVSEAGRILPRSANGPTSPCAIWETPTGTTITRWATERMPTHSRT
jgi:hypothetical protein